MTAVWITLAIIAVIVAVAVLARARLRGASSTPEALKPADDREAEGAEGALAGRPAVPAETTPPTPAKDESEPRARRGSRETRDTATAAKGQPLEAAPAAGAPPSEADLRAEVGTLLEESERMLGELKRGANDGSVGVLEEGLQEVRALAERKKWSQAREKGEALRAQLSLMLPSSRGKQAS